MTYDELYQAVRDWSENPGGELAAEIPKLIEFAEKRIYRDVDLKVTHREQNYPIAPGTSTIAKPSGSFVIRWLRFTGDESGVLDKQDPSVVAEFSEGGTALGMPRMFCETNDDLLTFAPAAYQVGTMTIADTYRPDGLSDANPETWLSMNAPEVLHYAVLLEAAIFMKQQGNSQAPGALPVYRERYQEALVNLRAEEARKSVNMFRMGERG